MTTDMRAPNPEIEALLREIVHTRRIPSATYRFQFGPELTYAKAHSLVPYLHELGVTELYASPLYKPHEGSTHGYDVVDYTQLNPMLGTREEFDRLVERLKAYGMGFVFDVVPNHMGIADDNPYWMDVLRHGPASPYAEYFDINWYPPKRLLDEKVLLPILEDHYGRVLEDGKLQLSYEQHSFCLNYWEHCLPVSVASWGRIFAETLNALRLPQQAHARVELESLLHAVGSLPAYAAFQTGNAHAYLREQHVVARRFADLYDANPAVRAALAVALEWLNGTPGEPASYDALDGILAQQHYQLAFWRVAADEINYRRFFDINTMAALNVQIPEVFHDVHRLTLQLAAQGDVTGLRIDHPDGLWDPTAYFQRLQDAYLQARLRHALAERGLDAEQIEQQVAQVTLNPTPHGQAPLYVVAEKILSEIEPLPETWALDGTTGYDFLIAVNSIFVNRDHVGQFDALYSRFIGKSIDYRELIYQSKRLIMDLSLASEINQRAQQIARVVSRNRRFRGYTLNNLAFALREIIASMSIYRTYTAEPGSASERDRFYVAEAIEHAKARNPRSPHDVFNFLHDVLLMQPIEGFSEAEQAELNTFTMRFQQITGPVMAKSVEDTAFYIYNRLTSLNEVGGNPEQFGIGVLDLHEHNRWHQEHWPHTLVATSTHDTKRSEDVRARLNVLSEMPDEWEGAIQRWAALAEAGKTEVGGAPAPDRNDEYLFYQALVGIWDPDTPDFAALHQRLHDYLQKATNEAKVHTSWTMPNHAYDAAITRFIAHCFETPALLDDVQAFVRRIAPYGRTNSLAQTLLKLTSPGVPDIYQGTELWDYSLVDPDNRRPVDYERRQAALAELRERIASGDLAALADELVAQAEDGRIKLYTIARTLAFRREQRALFDQGAYTSVDADGPKAAHVCAFARTHQDASLVTVVPVLAAGLTGLYDSSPLGDVWDDTVITLPESWAGRTARHLFTGAEYAVPQDGRLLLRDVLRAFPVALLALG